MIVRLAKEIFLDSPVSRLGANFATAVALAYGAPLSTGKIERHNSLIVLRGLPRWSFKRGGVCVGRVYLTNQNVSPRVLKHEEVHVRQWRRYGLLFPILYALAGADALKNRFEIEAGLEDGGYVRRGGKPRAR
ncbi:Fe-S oxidoreductase [Gulosibacter molinativorax]|uniref:Fe-S oxidoreductase n=1 Tax=Gulosibacter molinativorax TaxID=256821 RepID=A0ABT7C3S7_9MICO|nr:Fe-S oxidoreductase [Gulosibacter molinativorax]MDJ1369902.1 Fe-S oxidoreductase [Gulosibacter molinativorax]QUY61871.1 Fe-S oxidoreductase [Gulosibacter molinativorax]